VQGAEMSDLEHNEDLQRLYREQQGWIADTLVGLYEQLIKQKAEAQRPSKEHPSPATVQGRITQAIAMLNEQAGEENYPETQAALENESKERLTVSNRLYDNLVKALRLIRRPLLFFWAVFILLFIASFFFTSTPSPVAKVATPVSKSLEKSCQTSEIIPSPPLPPTKQSIKSTPITDWEEVKGILEQIREAQLKKDITLFLNVYSPSFPNIDKKKESILKTWHRYNYLDMRFHIKDIQKPNSHTIVSRIAWDITFVNIRSKKKSTLVMDYTIHFSNVSGRWLIQELIRGKETSGFSVRSTGSALSYCLASPSTARAFR
jgi:hypothetical protein